MTSAERTRKHRAQKTLNELKISLPPNEVKRKILGAQKSYLFLTKNKEIAKHQTNPNTFYFLVECADQKGYLVFRRIFKEGEKKSCVEPRKPKILSREEAEREFQEIVFNKSKRWKTIDHYKDKAIEFHINSRQGSESSIGRYPIDQFSFLMALDEILCDGFKVLKDGAEFIEKGTKSSSLNRTTELQRSRRYLMHLFRNPTLPPFEDTLGWENAFRKMFTEIVYDTNEDNEVSDKTYVEKGSMILSLADSLTRYSAVLGSSVLTLPKIAKNEFDHIRKAYTNNQVETEPTIIPTKSFEMIDIELLEPLLERLWNQSKDDYHAALFGLSTLLRPTEIERFFKSPDSYIKNKHFLNYGDGKLITKTLRKTDISKLPNPCLQIVSRLIAFHIRPQLNLENFYKKNKDGFRSDEKFSDIFFRRFRTTGAVMVKYTSTDHEAQTRMGHTTPQMVSTTYAPLIPSVKNPELYLGIRHSTFSILLNGVKHQFSNQSSLWDLWLLRDFMKRHLSELKSSTEQEAFKRRCLEEARVYDLVKNGDSSSLEETVL